MQGPMAVPEVPACLIVGLTGSWKPITLVCYKYKNGNSHSKNKKLKKYSKNDVIIHTAYPDLQLALRPNKWLPHCEASSVCDN